MMSDQLLTRKVESLRSEMIRVAEDKGNLLDPHVIQLSQQLDQLLILMQRLHKNAPHNSHYGDQLR